MTGQQQSTSRRLNRHWQSGGISENDKDGLIPMPTGIFGNGDYTWMFNGIRYGGSDKWCALNYHDELATVKRDDSEARNVYSYPLDTVKNSKFVKGWKYYDKSAGKYIYRIIKGGLESTLTPLSWPMKHNTTPNVQIQQFNTTLYYSTYDKTYKWFRFNNVDDNDIPVREALIAPYDNSAQLLRFKVLVYFPIQSDGDWNLAFDNVVTETDKAKCITLSDDAYTESYRLFQQEFYKLIYRIPPELRDCKLLYLDNQYSPYTEIGQWFHGVPLLGGLINMNAFYDTSSGLLPGLSQWGGIEPYHGYYHAVTALHHKYDTSESMLDNTEINHEYNYWYACRVIKSFDYITAPIFTIS